MNQAREGGNATIMKKLHISFGLIDFNGEGRKDDDGLWYVSRNLITDHRGDRNIAKLIAPLTTGRFETESDLEDAFGEAAKRHIAANG